MIPYKDRHLALRFNCKEAVPETFIVQTLKVDRAVIREMCCALYSWGLELLKGLVKGGS